MSEDLWRIISWLSLDLCIIDNIPTSLKLSIVVGVDNGLIFAAIATQAVHNGKVVTADHTIAVTVWTLLVVAEFLHVLPHSLSGTVQVKGTILEGSLLVWIIILEDRSSSINPVWHRDEESTAEITSWVRSGASQGGVAIACSLTDAPHTIWWQLVLVLTIHYTCY